MKRISCEPRADFKKKLEELGFGFHTIKKEAYWTEDACYTFTADEIEKIEAATNELAEMFIEAARFVIEENMYDLLKIPEFMIPLIEKSWNDDYPSLYGRFDLVFKNGEIKLLEYNADTPTSIFEAAVVQWKWLEETNGSKDQFNSIHEALIRHWAYLSTYMYEGTLYFTCSRNSLEDLTTVEYLRDCAMQAQIPTKLIYINDIGWDEERKCFVDLEDEPILNIFKLYPYEALAAEAFGENLVRDVNNPCWIEPAWKMVISNKGILPILWDLYKDHPLLLKAQTTPVGMASYAKKPLLSREGANITLVKDGQTIEMSKGGGYGSEGYIYQELYELPDYEGNKPVIGSWLINHESVGIGIRETNSLITDNTSRFVPHYFE